MIVEFLIAVFCGLVVCAVVEIAGWIISEVLSALEEVKDE
jgi:hypothetical protein